MAKIQSTCRRANNWKLYIALYFQFFTSLVVCQVQDSEYRHYVGVIFAPVVNNIGKDWKARDWTAYTQEEIKTMLDIVNTKFSNISTFSVGATEANVTALDKGDAVGHTGIMAANINKEANALKLSALLAVWQSPTKPVLRTEIRKAVELSKMANSIYAGTVWGIIFSSNYINENDDIIEKHVPRVLEMIEYGKSEFVRQGVTVKVGVRLETCDLLISADKNSDFLIPLLKELDFVNCFKLPVREVGRQGIPKAVSIMSSMFAQIKIEMALINKNLQVIFETGWPSKGITRNYVPTSIDNMREFWSQLSASAVKNKFHLHFFEAFDEPWKNDLTKDRSSHEGPCGGEAYFGWWRRRDNDDHTINAYIEKIQEKQTPLCEEDGRTPIIWGVSMAIGFLVLLVAILYLYYKLRKVTAEMLTEADIEEFEKGMELSDGEGDNMEKALLLPYDRKYELLKSHLRINKQKILGSGQFGVVYKGTIEHIDAEVAFKTTKPRCPAQNLKSLLAEIKLMIYIGTHTNIVGILGAYTGEIREGGVFIACEYCANGSLEKVLREMYDGKQYANVSVQFKEAKKTHTRNSLEGKYENSPEVCLKNKLEFNMQNLIRWSADIARGMDHLATKKVIHADLATRNVLLTENGVAKITDFGLSRKMYAYTTYVKHKQEPLPWRWMAVESLQRLAFSTDSDMWSYGVTLWEIFSLAEIPYPGLNWEIDFVDKLKNGLRLQKPKQATGEIYMEMHKCWNAIPELRPKFIDMVSFFEKQIHVNQNKGVL